MIRGQAVRTEESDDPRVAAILDVLRGEPTADVARRWSVDVAVLVRWVRAFTEAGTAQVTNTPDPAAAQQRDRFLAAFAHEIRSPLTVAQGWAHLLSDDEVSGDDYKHCIKQLEESLNRLESITADVERLTSASLGRLKLFPARVPIGHLVTDLPGLAEVEGAGPWTEIYVDPGHFRPVLRDLWAAGLQRPSPRSLRMFVIDVAPWVEIRVVREADPIDPTVLQALFEPFERNDDRTGVTIGLYLARALTVAHGGTIGVDQNEDGAVLWVRIPHPPHHR